LLPQLLGLRQQLLQALFRIGGHARA
jgi:hypothetical protein